MGFGSFLSTLLEGAGKTSIRSTKQIVRLARCVEVDRPGGGEIEGLRPKARGVFSQRVTALL